MIYRGSYTAVLLLTAAVLWSASGVAHASYMDKTNGKDIFTLGQIVVTDKASPVNGITVETVSSRQMQEFNRENVADALNLVPGITLSRSGARNEQMIFVRGFDIKHAPLFLDGIPIYVLYDGYPDLGRFTTFDLSQIVVSKGFSSVLYGPNTMGGAINMVSRRPDKFFEGNAGVGVASGDTITTHGNFGTNQGKWYLQGGFSYADQDYFSVSDNFKPTANEDGGDRENSYRTDQKINLKIGYTPSELDEYAFSYIRQDGEKGTPLYAGNDPSARIRYWQWPYWDKESFYFNSRTSINQKGYVKTRLYYDTYKNSLFSYDDATYTTMTKGYSFKSAYDDYTIGGSLEAGSKYLSGHFIKAAFHYKKDVHEEKDEGKPKLNFQDEIFSFGLEDTITLSENISIIIGASYDYLSPGNADNFDSDTGIISDFSSREVDAFNPQISLFYDISDTGTVHVAVAEKSRLPTLKDRYSYRMGYGLPNPDLDEETSVNYEIGYQDNFADRVCFKSSVFYSDVSNYIMAVSVPDPDDATGTVDQNQNIGAVNIYGAEAQVSAYLLNNLEYGLGYTYMDWDNQSSDEKLTDIPRHKIFTHIKYSPVKRLSLLTSLEYNAKRFSNSDGATQAGSYALINCKADCTLYKNIKLEAGVNNLFDRNYEIDEGYIEPGRNYFINLTCQF
ncbi:TonB-dependent receptor plug domain-containing protein [Desulfobacula phenolica]|uniref:Iron complex outermembrane recepter protein n=1 Tax=Desulfobacula phenolica TaxID=90732 RepID=A0A1H2HIN4_9BACT|nr:TonB-dependent receptor [Desulfobacula phenolica]SDU31599.1 iron complex outermembrane recepter protein [Desulfobacula phenolica]